MTRKKIGVLTGREWSWPPAFIEEVNRRSSGVSAEFVRLGGTRMAEVCEYDVIIDRISHEVPYYRTFLKTAMMSGSTVINNPFCCGADDRFLAASLATEMGILHPRSVALPSHSYREGIESSLHNHLIYPLPWEEFVNYLGGFPVVLRPVWGDMFGRLPPIHTLEDIWSTYNQTGTEAMMLQEFLTWDKYVRCICIGQEHAICIRYDPDGTFTNSYFLDEDYLTEDESEQVIDHTLTLTRALGYDINAVDCAIRGDQIYVMDFVNPIPDFDVNSITPYYFDWVVKTIVDFTIELARGRRQTIRDVNLGKLVQLTQRTPASTGKRKASRKKKEE